MFYDVYVKLCEEHGEKPYSVPYKLGWSNNSIVKQWSLGSTPRKDKLVQIANYFNVPVAYLLTEDESLLETKKPATEVTGDGLDVIRDEIMPRVEQLSQKEVLRLIGELAQRIERGNKNDEG